MYDLKIGILIIGSLLWETEKFDRENWRNERLNVRAQQKVETRMRYARISESRGWTYTMVFSESAQPSTAVVVPCLRRAQTLDDVLVEARRLAMAENLGADGKWRAFGAVGALPNPQRERARQALRQWPTYYRDHLHRLCEAPVLSGPAELPSLTQDGFLAV
ncbi:MAG: hypothetical protein ACXWI9_23355, partial [Burkholderiales bacterium]